MLSLLFFLIDDGWLFRVTLQDAINRILIVYDTLQYTN